MTQSDVLTALRGFLLAVLPGIEVVLAQINRVPEPQGDNFVTMTPILLERLETNTDEFDPLASTMTITQPIRVTVQLDIHGPAGADNAQTVTTLFRDAYGVALFGSNVVPLYTSAPHQLPFENENQQVEDRWVVDVVMQANQALTVSQDSADQLDVTLIGVEAAYPI